MKRIVVCPKCDTESKVGPIGEEDGLVAIWGKSGAKIVLHCNRCNEAFVGRPSLFGRMKTWELDPMSKSAIGQRHGHVMKRRGEDGDEVQCPSCGKTFFTQRALASHQADKHSATYEGT